ncbi:phage tail sheath family protein [Bacillus badius]|uniref:Phage-like element PBSX protein xkdK n=1 Tax=Bacillus badius TaxID=1455 RepID=A0ABR5B288_BACBA|nr:phage tail sheath family protein [Bacillus badius]KIL80731.1 Phage-like element PBSX protein xkdK [Bacillus badius]MED4715340.1 phage tail sheath family protein [Bacillus badius]
MNGGTFTPGEEKQRAGIYFRFTSAANDRLAVGERGIVALPLVLNWGAPKQFIEVTKTEDVEKKLGLDINDPSLLLLREAKKKAKTVLAYRVNEGTKATKEVATGVTATAVYGGTKGNDITIKVAPNVVDETKKDVTTFMGTKAVDKQTVANGSELKANAWVTFQGAGELIDSAGIKLVGGADGTPTNLDYTDFFSAAETEYFDVIALPVDDEQLKTAFVSFVKRMREQKGVKIRGVLANYAGDYEGIDNVTVGAVLPEKTLTPAETVAWVAGAAAGATIYQSLTFVEYEGAIDVTPRLDNDEIIERLAKGEFMLTFDARDKTVTVEKDINSFVSFTKEKDKKFQKNKIVRILDAINNDLTREIKREIKIRKEKGQDIPVNGDGVQIISTLVTIYMNALQEGGAITNFNSQNDIQIAINADGDGFYINTGAQPVDSAEKFYFGMEVR